MKSGCPYCAGKNTIYNESFGYLYPKLMEDFLYELNPGTDPYSLSPGSDRKIHWKCAKNSDHLSWTTSLEQRTKRKHGCPYCTGKLFRPNSSFAGQYPELLKEFKWTRNVGIDPYTLAPRGSRKVWWQCSKNEKHQWFAAINSRTYQKTGCPECRLQRTSKREIRIACELYTLFELPPKISKKNPKIEKWECDIVLPHPKLVIEYDGWRWHSFAYSYSRDTRKTKELQTAGWSVLRIREAPLVKMASHDIVVTLIYLFIKRFAKFCLT